MLIAKVDKIIELRKAHGLNQKRLSEKAGLPVNFELKRVHIRAPKI